jgi:hypothetical protein
VESWPTNSGYCVSGLARCASPVDVAGIVLGLAAMGLWFLLFYNRDRQLLLVGDRMGLFRSDRGPRSLAKKIPYSRYC